MYQVILLIFFGNQPGNSRLCFEKNKSHAKPVPFLCFNLLIEKRLLTPIENAR